jgi:hypothetical protein
MTAKNLPPLEVGQAAFFAARQETECLRREKLSQGTGTKTISAGSVAICNATSA